MKNVPKHIYLNLGLSSKNECNDFGELDEVTWSEDKINDGDIRYILDKRQQEKIEINHMAVKGIYSTAHFFIVDEIAAAEMHVYNSRAEIDGMYVAEEYQRQGIGTKLCDEIDKYADGKNIRIILDGPEAIATKPFFEKRGYEVIIFD